MNQKLYLFDLEGTTTDIHFVHKILFPYAFERIEDFLLKNKNELSTVLDLAKKTIEEETKLSVSLPEIISYLKLWIQSDRKHPALKEIQGLIWETGYKKQDFKGHLYPDVLPFFEKIKKTGSLIGIYSSGSVHAQKLLLNYSCEGDVTPYITFYFDTKIGHKRETESYRIISLQTKIYPENIYFFSDIKEELEAAQKEKINCIQLKRYEILKGNFPVIDKFSEFKI